jgi:sugar lactone lactonase YvrE
VLNLAVDGTGQIFALDKLSNEVFKYNFTGSQLARFGAGVRGLPYAIATDAEDRVYVSDERYIQVYDGTGNHLGRVTLPNDAGPMHSLAFGPSNELYALSQQSGIVYRFAVGR